MKHYDVIVIGFGKAGKTLAVKLANQGKQVALIEENPKMYGGTCINIGCIPTKTLMVAAEKGLSFEDMMAEKDAVVNRLNAKNFAMIGSVVDIYVAHAKFMSNKVIKLVGDTEHEALTAEIIIINTGAKTNVLPIEGLSTSQFVYDSTSIQQLTKQPKRLGIIGGGNIGLEFATLFAKSGTEVTVFESNSKLLSRYEPIVSELAMDYMSQQGITFELNAKINKVSSSTNEVSVYTQDGEYTFDALLHATGRIPNTADLNLENTDIALDNRGAIVVDAFCQTTVNNVFAVGDVKGGLQFTYVSLDDFRIVFNYLNGDSSYNLETRKHIPTTTFLNPPLSQIGLTEEQAKADNLPYATKEILVAAMPRAHVNGDLRGVFKAVVNTQTKEILGVTLYGSNSQEVINLITMAMDNHIPYTYFAEQLFTHPTMTENLNDLFAL